MFGCNEKTERKEEKFNGKSRELSLTASLVLDAGTLGCDVIFKNLCDSNISAYFPDSHNGRQLMIWCFEDEYGGVLKIPRVPPKARSGPIGPVTLRSGGSLSIQCDLSDGWDTSNFIGSGESSRCWFEYNCPSCFCNSRQNDAQFWAGSIKSNIVSLPRKLYEYFPIETAFYR